VEVLLAVVTLCAAQLVAQDGALGGLFGVWASSGKVAKLQFELTDDIAVTSLAWSPDGRYIAASSMESNWIHIWDLQRKTLSAKFQTESGTPEIHELSWSPKGHYLVACDFHGQRRIYDTTHWTQAHVIAPERDNCRASEFSSDGLELAVLGAAVSVYDTNDWRLIRILDLKSNWWGGRSVNSIAYVPGSHTLLLGGSDREESNKPFDHIGNIWVLKPTDSAPSRNFPAYLADRPNLTGGVVRMAVSPDGMRVATGTETGAGSYAPVKASVHILRISDGALLGKPLDGQDFGDQRPGVQFTPNGHWLLVAHGGIHVAHVIHLIDAGTLRVEDEVSAGHNTIYDLAIHPNSTQFAVAAGNHIAIWSLPNKP